MSDSSGPTRGRSFEDDLRGAVEFALRGLGVQHASRGRATGYLKSDLAAELAPKVVEHMVFRGWQFRHRAWPEGAIVGRSGEVARAPSTERHGPKADS